MCVGRVDTEGFGRRRLANQKQELSYKQNIIQNLKQTSYFDYKSLVLPSAQINNKNKTCDTTTSCSDFDVCGDTVCAECSAGFQCNNITSRCECKFVSTSDIYAPLLRRNVRLTHSFIYLS